MVSWIEGSVMSKWMVAAAIVSLITLIVHVFAGGPEVHDALLAADIPVILKTYVSVIWHASTAVLLVNSLALGVAAFREPIRRPVAWIVTLQYLAYAALFVVYPLANLGTLLEMPQWIVFIAISGLALMGTTGRTSEIGGQAPVAMRADRA
jgi:hypothetical protein